VTRIAAARAPARARLAPLAAIGLIALALAPGPFASAPARAQVGSLLGDGGGGKQVEILADEGIEWRQNEKMYIARGNVRAKQGDVALETETLTALYRDRPNGGTDIYRVIAEGKVKVTARNGVVTGDRAVYEVDRGVVVMTGQSLRMVAGEDVVTARDSLEYWEKRDLAVARGDATAVRANRRMRADVLSAQIGGNQGEERKIQRIDAFGSVVVASDADVARADSGVYNVERGVATLRGNVKLTRGVNQLNGEVAVVDLNTGVSRLLPGTGRGGRVTGLITPRQDTADRKPPPAPTSAVSPAPAGPSAPAAAPAATSAGTAPASAAPAGAMPAGTAPTTAPSQAAPSQAAPSQAAVVPSPVLPARKPAPPR